jgi:hypothetical protein
MSRRNHFDRSQIGLDALGRRGHDLTWSGCPGLGPTAGPYDHPELPRLAGDIAAARDRGRSVVLMLGGHPIKVGLTRYGSSEKICNTASEEYATQ